MEHKNRALIKIKIILFEFQISGLQVIRTVIYDLSRD